jgi:hypothetical protein
MSKQQYITPTIAVTGDTTGYMNVISTTPGGELQVVTTGATVNTIGPDKYIVVGDVLVSPGHYKTIPTDYHINGNLTIEALPPITIGSETVAYTGYLGVDGYLNCTGTINNNGTLFVYGPAGTGSTSGTSGGYDADAQAFLTAAAITDVTIGGAINTLVLSIKAANVWGKIVAAYPFVGGTASTHKYNLKNPLDTDAAFRMTFVGGNWVHNSSGVQLVGSLVGSNYANTHLAYQTEGLTTAHLLESINLAGGEGGYDIGSSGGDAGDWALISDYGNGISYFSAGAGSYLTSDNGGATGVFSGRANGTNRYLDKNGTNLTTDSGSVDGSTLPLYLSAVNINGTAAQNTKNRFDFASYGTYLTSQELTDYYNAIETFNTTLGR